MPRTPEPPAHEDVLAEMVACEPYWAGELAESFEASRRTIQRRLNELAEQGRVRKKKRSSRRAVYWIEPE